MIFDIREDAHNFGLTEDGEAHIGGILYIFVEEPHGNRFAHNFTLPTTEVFEDEEGIARFADISKRSYAWIERLKNKIEAHVAAGGSLDPNEWHEMDPRYGSDAYIAMDDLGIFKAREKQKVDLETRQGSLYNMCMV